MATFIFCIFFYVIDIKNANSGSFLDDASEFRIGAIMSLFTFSD